VSKAKLHIIGKVQGVCYRLSAQTMAESMNLSGWIKNLPDGSVLAHAQGSSTNIQAFLSWCKQGPPKAQVETVELTWLSEIDLATEAPDDQNAGFKIIG
jgi:acylphosphatase